MFWPLLNGFARPRAFIEPEGLWSYTLMRPACFGAESCSRQLISMGTTSVPRLPHLQKGPRGEQKHEGYHRQHDNGGVQRRPLLNLRVYVVSLKSKERDEILYAPQQEQQPPGAISAITNRYNKQHNRILSFKTANLYDIHNKIPTQASSQFDLISTGQLFIHMKSSWWTVNAAFGW